MTRPFRLIDVFGTDPLTGNPLAVIANAEGLSGEDMQRMANWLDFAETTFLLQPDDTAADYRVRIFTRERELPFAGHPTLGSTHAWLEAGGQPKQDGVVGPHRTGGDASFEVRAIISPGHGSLLEDPVTGSLNASVGQWLFASGRASGSYAAAQGTRLGRTGRIHVSQDDTGQVWVAGTTRTLFSGSVHG